MVRTIWRGPSIGPPWCRGTPVSRTAVRLIAVVFSQDEDHACTEHVAIFSPFLTSERLTPIVIMGVQLKDPLKSQKKPVPKIGQLPPLRQGRHSLVCISARIANILCLSFYESFQCKDSSYDAFRPKPNPKKVVWVGEDIFNKVLVSELIGIITSERSERSSY